MTWVKPKLKAMDERGAEYSFANSLVWGSVYHQQVACVDGFFVSRAGADDPHYNFPCGEGDVKAVIQRMADDAAARGYPFRLRALSASTKEKLETLLPDRFEYIAVRNWDDYIYEVNDLLELAGRKYQPKRNLISRFKNNNEWTYEDISRENIAECMAMNEEWCRRNGCNDQGSLRLEAEAAAAMLAQFCALDLRGGLLRVQGEVVAYTVGEPLCSDTFIVHIEKAFTEFQGAYQMINQQFLLHHAAGFRYVNREDDAGDAGLRKAKLSYYPAFMQEKFIAVDRLSNGTPQ
ncbi:MAG: phosphatidylglycerol lysyltransferase domain-containing protein [Prevotellaceae bacterium]|nr:phosphatidylglycerol lysyltransferase domain-containing protein [Prevotellaceae bacterium]